MKAQRLHRDQKLEWSDIPFILTVCESGSLAGAARLLGVNHSTVFRRVESAEARLGVRLFERRRRGYVMTPAGELFLEYANALCDGMDRIERELCGKDLRLEGPLTVTTTDSLLHCLAPVFAAFQAKHPDIELRLLSDVRALDLTQRDADIALRPTPDPPEHWIGRRLSALSFATYAQNDYWREACHLAPEHLRWVLLGDDLNQSPMSRLAMRHRVKEANVTIVNTMMSVLDLVRSGNGIAAMPCYLGEGHPDLVRVHAPDMSANWHLWLLTHPDVRRSARVNAFYDFAVTHITEAVLAQPGP